MSGAAGIPTVHGGEEVNGPEARSATVSAAGMSSGVELPPRRRSWANHGRAGSRAGVGVRGSTRPSLGGRADDARTQPQPWLRSGTPSRGTSQQALTEAH
jgi:hypothetical protein